MDGIGKDIHNLPAVGNAKSEISHENKEEKDKDLDGFLSLCVYSTFFGQSFAIWRVLCT